LEEGGTGAVGRSEIRPAATARQRGERPKPEGLLQVAMRVKKSE
jgi:hypothetical protein